MSFSDLKWAVVILNESSYKLFQCKNISSVKKSMAHFLHIIIMKMSLSDLKWPVVTLNESRSILF